DFNRAQRLPSKRGNRWGETAAAVERWDDHTHRKVAGGFRAISSREAKQGERAQRQRVARNVENQHREGEQENATSGERLQHLEHEATSRQAIRLFLLI